MPATPDQAQIDHAKAQALMEFAGEQARLGRLQIARLAYKQVLTRADRDTTAKVQRELESLRAQARNCAQLLNERDYEPFAEGLNGSSRRVNECRFHGLMYSCTKDEARALFARYLVEQEVTPELQTNIRYPLFHWGDNHANLQWGMALAVTDVINERAEGGPNGLASCFEAKKELQPTLHRSFDLLRRICAGDTIPASDKGRIYWRLSEAFSLLAAEDPEKAPPFMKAFLGDLKNTLAPFAAYKDQIQPAELNSNTGDTF